MGVPAGSKSVGPGREPGLENRLQYHQQDLLNDPVLKAGLVGLEHSLELTLGEELDTGLVVGAPNELLGLLVPVEIPANDGISEGEEVMEDVGVDGVAGRERAGHVSTGALIGQDPEVEFGEEAGEVGEREGGWGREGLDPQS